MKKGILLLSSGIDSPVAGYLAREKIELIGLHLDHVPLRSSKKAKIKQLCDRVKIKKCYIVPFGTLQIELMKKCEDRYRCVICRRFMLRIAEKIAEKEKADYLITGENLSQVASQTLTNLKNEDTAIKTIILRPLLCYDKQEIINLAKTIGTFEISIQQNSCCGAVPKFPITKSNKRILEREEEKLNIDKLISDYAPFHRHRQR